MLQVAKVFKSGNSQAICWSNEFPFSVAEVEISREDHAIILQPHFERKRDWNLLRSALTHGVSDGFMENRREQLKEQDRSRMDELFN